MKKKSMIKTSVVCWLMLSGAVVQAQQAILSSGGIAKGNGGTVSYSVGQVFYKTATGTNGSVGGFRNANNATVEEDATGADGYSIAEGVQQAYDIDEVTAIEGTESITLQCAVHPNPVTDMLQLNVVDYPVKYLFYQLFDYNGRLLINQKIENAETNISMEGKAEAIYILKVTDSQNKNEIKTFKIIKN